MRGDKNQLDLLEVRESELRLDSTSARLVRSNNNTVGIGWRPTGLFTAVSPSSMEEKNAKYYCDTRVLTARRLHITQSLMSTIKQDKVQLFVILCAHLSTLFVGETVGTQLML